MNRFFPKQVIKTFRRNMSTEYNVIIYDLPGVSRTALRPAHLKQIAPSVNAGIVTSVGALFTDETKTQFVGSNYHIVAKNKVEVIEFLKKDVFYTEGIWDIDSVLIHPIGVAARLPKVHPEVNAELYK